MSLTHPRSFVLGLAFLALAWSGSFGAVGMPPFSAHMLMHMVVVAVAAPLLVVGISASSLDPVRRHPAAFSAVLASMLEFVAVWAWHTPLFHHAARTHPMAFVAEQLTFLCSGLFLWIAAWGGDAPQRRNRSVPGIVGLLLTSMHMTLLGALIALSRRPLYGHHGSVDPLVDQQIGGVIMLFLGAASYLAGGVLLAAKSLAKRREEPPGIASGQAGAAASPALIERGGSS